ncbi:MAG: ribosome small subunit-dependent GTPase A [Rikenellaceae bacterium]|jgi:ribosome biogenesis GTPase|nr:ribosome small subunit-dependent GTPase A [Rikenellaceae bacterium]
MTHEATIIRSTGSWYEVRDEAGAVSEARIRGRLRLSGRRSTNPVVVGDRVLCSSDEGGEVWIEEILPRTNYIIRRASNLSKESHIIAANIDQAAVVATLFSPATSPEFIDRFLVTAEAYRIPATIVLNKADLAEQTPEALERFVAIYRQAGYRVLRTSTVTGEGVEEFRDYLRGKTTLISGNSGVGKSTLIKTVEPTLDIRIGEVSRAHHKGMHTTTFSQMYALTQGGYIIDTPGIKGFGLIDIDPAELGRYFPEFRRYSPECQYYNCTHVHEPGCAVQRAVEQGSVSEERYISYLKMLEEDEKYRK